jgi:hypothetical protein
LTEKGIINHHFLLFYVIDIIKKYPNVLRISIFRLSIVVAGGACGAYGGGERGLQDVDGET